MTLNFCSTVKEYRGLLANVSGRVFASSWIWLLSAGQVLCFEFRKENVRC